MQSVLSNQGTSEHVRASQICSSWRHSFIEGCTTPHTALKFCHGLETTGHLSLSKLRFIHRTLPTKHDQTKGYINAPYQKVMTTSHTLNIWQGPVLLQTNSASFSVGLASCFGCGFGVESAFLSHIFGFWPVSLQDLGAPEKGKAVVRAPNIYIYIYLTYNSTNII